MTDTIKPHDHPDYIGGIIWAPCEIRWIEAALEAARQEGFDAGYHKGAMAEIAQNKELRAKLKLATEVLEQAVEVGGGVSYSGEDDEVGEHACCGTLTYEEHKPDFRELTAELASAHADIEREVGEWNSEVAAHEVTRRKLAEAEARTDSLMTTISAVCEGWTLPDGARKSLESALYAETGFDALTALLAAERSKALSDAYTQCHCISLQRVGTALECKSAIKGMMK